MLRLSIMFLPLVMAVSFASIFFINNLAQSYKNYLLQSYIGTQGVLSVNSTDVAYLKALQSAFLEQKIKSSLKKEVRRDVIFKTKEYTLEKKMKFIILEETYLLEKLDATQPLVLNKILANILGDTTTILIKQPDAANFEKLQNLQVIDTGFLSSEPLVFVGKDFFESLGFHQSSYDSLELSITLDEMEYAKKLSKQISEEFSADISFEDILSQHKETEVLFENIRYIELMVLLITSLLSIVILTGALSIIAKIKEKAIMLLRIYGLSTYFISWSLTLMSVMILGISILLALVLFIFMKEYFIMTLSLDNGFFLKLDTTVIYIVSAIFLVFSSITYLWAYITFKGQIKI